MTILPWDDWQFWVVTLFAAAGAWIVLRQLLPAKDGPACGACATGAAACAKKDPAAAASTGSEGDPRLVVLGDRRTVH